MESESDPNKTESRRTERKTSSAPASRSFLRRPKTGVFDASARGFIPVLLILVLFLLAAIYVKPLFFGILAAVLSFRLEQFLERRFFATRFIRGIYAFFEKLCAPFVAFRKRITRRIGNGSETVPAAKEDETSQKTGGIPLEERRRIATHASALTVILAVVATILVCWGLVHFIRPFTTMSGESMSKWAQNNHVIEMLEQKLDALLDRLDPPEPEEEAATTDAAVAGKDEPVSGDPAVTEQAGPVPGSEAAVAETGEPVSPEKPARNVRDRLRGQLAGVLEEHNVDLAKFSLRAGNTVIRNLYHVTAWAGTFAFDFFMFLFFFYYFLFKMAVFSAGREDPKQSLGEWTVSSIYQSGWLPDASENERKGAARIIEHIYGMFRTWLVGYFWIIVLETILYALFFALFNVPYWPLLALFAGTTILLPFLGPALAVILSVTVTVIFAQEGIVMPLIGIALAFLLINGLLEQLLLYPMFVGEAIGLTLVETIIVVLLGAVIAGISGMILVVPAAALLKLLAPLFYETLNKQLRRRRLAKRGESGT